LQIRARSRAECNLVANVCKFVAKFKSQRGDLLFYYLHLLDHEQALTDFLCEPNVPLRAALLGKVSADHIAISNGLLYRFCGMARFMEICKSSANKAFENGELEHAVLCRVLCGEFNGAAVAVFKLLCSHIEDKADNPSKRFIVKMAKDLFSSNKRLEHDRNFHELSSIDPSMVRPINKGNVGNLVIAILFADFYDLYSFQSDPGSDQHERALEMIEKSDLIPLRGELAIAFSSQSRRHELMKPFLDHTLRIDSNLQKFVGNICVAVMQILSLQFQACRMRQQQKEAQVISWKCDMVYAFVNKMESIIRPAAGDDTAQNISKYYYRTRLR